VLHDALRVSDGIGLAGKLENESKADILSMAISIWFGWIAHLHCEHKSFYALMDCFSPFLFAWADIAPIH
jgi:hypothetical protein